MKIEGQYRLLSHNEKHEAIYARLASTGTDWVRNWREATTFLTHESAQLARDAARMDEPTREIEIAQRFRSWPRKAWPKNAAAKDVGL